ncbi:proteasome maturation factor UMP1-domain-containing protein [Suillus bovinus]|uniref:proteasome maturation factor UMP1-domain-containing protein n=1 Tax=Suillus bovinus TaxID=48563 RepID=UPI001B87F9E1|nr:proteasome maturation factor UMP1-domain-containing protein [Suillus bovinus]KAG2160154.1 proteasome maturation factor UMP1-domain-containing protein [Suillus bovinus]
MEPSYRIIPPSQIKTASINDTAGSLGLHDTLQYGIRSIATETRGGEFENRITNWEETQDNARLHMLANLYGPSVPMRLLMERQIVSASPHMPGMPQSNIHLDILMGRDESLDPSDFFLGMESGPPLSIHNEMEKKLRL